MWLRPLNEGTDAPAILQLMFKQLGIAVARASGSGDQAETSWHHECGLFLVHAGRTVRHPHCMNHRVEVSLCALSAPLVIERTLSMVWQRACRRTSIWLQRLVCQNCCMQMASVRSADLPKVSDAAATCRYTGWRLDRYWSKMCCNVSWPEALQSCFFGNLYRSFAIALISRLHFRIISAGVSRSIMYDHMLCKCIRQ